METKTKTTNPIRAVGWIIYHTEPADLALLLWPHALSEPEWERALSRAIELARTPIQRWAAIITDEQYNLLLETAREKYGPLA